MLGSHNVLNPANGAPITVPSQDMVLGLYLSLIHISYRRVSSMPFLGLKTGSAEQELCPLFGNGCSRGELRL